MPLSANIGSGNYDNKNEEVMATYWVVFDISVNFENKQANCSALGYVNDKQYGEKRRPVTSRMFSWLSASLLNPFTFNHKSDILSQVQDAIIAYKMPDTEGKATAGEFSTATVIEGASNETANQ
jgi:hypothetical protein